MKAIYNLKYENWGLSPYINMRNRGKKHGTFFTEISSIMVN